MATLVIATIALAFAVRPTVLKFQWPSGSATYESGGIAFDYPASWVLHDRIPPTTGMGQTLAVIGTLPWGPCADYDLNCHYEQKLGPGQIELSVGRSIFLGEGGFCAFARERPDLAYSGPNAPHVLETRYFRVGSRPVIFTAIAGTADGYYLADEVRYWRIPETNNDNQSDTYSIQAMFRGPGDDDFRTALDRLIESLQFPTPYSLTIPAQGDCGAPFPAAVTN